MKPQESQLDRLLRNARQAQTSQSDELPFGLSTRVLAEWRNTVKTDEWMSVAPLMRRLLAATCAVVVIVVSVNYQALKYRSTLEYTGLNAAVQLSLVE